MKGDAHHGAGLVREEGSGGGSIDLVCWRVEKSYVEGIFRVQSRE